MDVGSYTQGMYENLINAAEAGYDADCDYSMLLEMINSPDFFEPFSERLRRFISKRSGTDYSAREAYLFLFDKMREAGTDPNRTKIKNWLNVRDASEGDSGPNMGDDGREAMFEAAFSLGLSVEETEDFFHRVFLDKAFNPRNIKEFVYFYCLLQGEEYSKAQELASKANEILSPSHEFDKVSGTVTVKSAAQNAKNDEELLTYIREHPFNFTRKSETALFTLDWILKDLQGGADRTGLVEQEFHAYKDDDVKGTEGRNVHSVDFVLEMVENGPGMIGNTDRSENIKKVRKIFTRKEIINQFPNANTISHPDSTYILRKDLILLYFYWYWVQDVLKGYSEGDYKSFVDEVNNILSSCGYGPLYYGNPYDWLFLYCSNCKDNGTSPLDVFRGILANNEDEDEVV